MSAEDVEETLRRIASHRGASRPALRACTMKPQALPASLPRRRLCRRHRLRLPAGVEGVLICNSAGTVLRTTMAATATARYAALLSRVVDAARGAVRGADAENDLVFLRLRSLKNEIMVVRVVASGGRRRHMEARRCGRIPALSRTASCAASPRHAAPRRFPTRSLSSS